MATLDVATITQGDDGGTSLIDPQDELASVDSGTDGNEFVNGNDMRTFVLVDNSSGGDRWVSFKIQKGIGTTSAQHAIKDTHSDGFNPGNCIIPDRLADGSVGLYGPFAPYYMNDEDGEVEFTIWRDDSGTFKSDATAVSSVTAAAFYLPWIDPLTGETSTAPGELGEPETTPVAVSIQTITPHGLQDPTFTDHSGSSNGWNCDLDSDYHDGTRFFAWLRNGTGGSITMRYYAGLYWPLGGSEDWLQWTAPDTDGYPRPNISTFAIADGDECFVGPFHKKYRYGLIYDLWIKDNANGTEASLDIAWLELPI